MRISRLGEIEDREGKENINMVQIDKKNREGVSKVGIKEEGRLGKQREWWSLKRSQGA